MGEDTGRDTSGSSTKTCIRYQPRARNPGGDCLIGIPAGYTRVE